MAEGDLLWKFAGAVVIGGTVYFVATHPTLMGEWVLWAAWQLRYYLLTVLILLTLGLVIHRRRQQKAATSQAAAIASHVTGGRQDTETADQPVQRVEHIHFHVDAGRTAHPYSCPCEGKAKVACEEPGDHNTHAACTNGRRPCPFPTDIQLEV